nr:SusC/RagA family TonB-linked outer membrane protein [uncultured Draconibacterium sp.]
MRKIFLILGMCFALLSSAYAQQKVTGVVTDEEGLGIPGASVVQKGTNNGTVTDLDGNYSISVPADAIIEFSFVGMKNVEERLDSRSVINVTLVTDAVGIDEVVVTALGIKREKKALGYSMSSIKADDLVKSGNPVNPLTSLYGKAAGVRVSGTANGPTGGMIINIRNSVSLSAESSTRPLFVVDGIPIFDENSGTGRDTRTGGDTGTGINDINAEDIESIEILKGAKASVLYGYAGANGVVLITTKTGAKKKGLGVEVNSSYTWDKVAYFPELQDEFGSGSSVGAALPGADETDADGFKYKDVNGVKTPVYYGNGATAGAGFGPKMDGREILWWDGQMRPYTPQKDNFKELFQTGHLRTNGFSISNAGDMGSVRMSYTNKKFASTVIGSDQDNHIFSFNGKLDISKRISVNYISNYYYTLNHNAPYRMQDGLVTYGINRDMKTELWANNIVDGTGVYWYFRDKELREAAGDLTGRISEAYYWRQKQNSYDETRHHLIQSLNTNIDFTDWLSLTLRTGFDMTRKMNENKEKVIRPLSEDKQQGWYSVAERNIFNLYNNAYLNFDKEINEDFRISGLVGFVYEKFSDRTVEAKAYNFLVENWFSLSNSSNDVKAEGGGYRSSSVLYGVLASAQIAYKNQLFVELQGRNDWSSILPPENNSYFYPGASLSWIASETLDLPEVIQYAKGRASFADVGRPGPIYFGNLAFDVNSYGGIAYATASSEMPPADFEAGIAEGKLPPENLKPERKREVELGFEMNFFQGNRLGIDFSWFTSNIYDQILALDVPKSSGVNKIRVNTGNTQNTGVELQLTGKPVLTHNFEWNTTLNLAQYNTKIKELSDGVEVLPLWGVTGASREAHVGGEYGEYYINPWKRDDSGNLVVGSNGVYEFDTEQQIKVGKQLPDLTGGLSNSFSYKGISLDFDIDFQFGGTLISQTNMYLKGNGTGKESLKYRDEARGGLPYYVDGDNKKNLLDSHNATVPGDSKYDFILHDGVILPGVKTDGSENDILISAQEYYENTYWQGAMDITEDAVYKSDYVAFRRVTLGYELPKRIMDKTFLTRARISVFGNNIAYLYKDAPNVTPESYAGTNEFTEYSGMPGVRSFGCEIKLGF